MFGYSFRATVSHYGSSPSKQHNTGSPSVASRSQSVFSKSSAAPSLRGTSKRDKSNKESKRRSSRKSDRESQTSIHSPTPTSQWYTTPEQELSSSIITSLGTTTVFELRQEVNMKCSIISGKYKHSHLKSYDGRVSK